MSYENILVPVDISANEAGQLLRSACGFTKVRPFTIVHVLCRGREHYTRDDQLCGASTEEGYWTAAQHLAALCEPFGIEAERQRVLIGEVAAAIVSVCIHGNFDLIIIGRHASRRPLIGPTAAGVISEAPCDVLSVPLHAA